ncbi:MAG: penicillin-binding transpeptidase domain-containing protein [Victivallaceae bacterium]
MKISQSVIRILILSSFMAIGMLTLLLKLGFEQIHRHSSYDKRIINQSIRLIRNPALRGRILTADHKILADNKPDYEVCLYLAEMRLPGKIGKTIDHIEKVIADIALRFGRPNQIKRAEIIRHINTRPGLPFTVFSNLNEREIAIVNEVAMNLKGISIVPQSSRFYPYGSLAAHVVGYARLRDPMRASDRKDYFYYISDYSGVSGLEKAYDNIPDEHPGELRGVRGLCGIPGFQIVQVDSRGFVDQVLPGGEAPFNGNSIVTTINFHAQDLAENVLRGYKGAFVVLDADTGAVIVMASAPSFNLADFSPKPNNPVIRALFKDKDSPQLNRALQSAYMPGSIIKPLVALAILKEGISPSETALCQGRVEIGNSAIRCTGIHGDADLLFALERSCNCYFINFALQLGVDKIRDVMEDAGLGSSTGIELPETSGQLPDKDYQRNRFGSKWTDFSTGLVSIGQGVILVSPLQAAVYAAALGNGGKLFQPYLVQEVRDKDGLLLYNAEPQIKRSLSVTDEQLAIVKEGMRRVVSAPRGSGREAAVSGLEIYGKTGSAEVGPRNNRHKNTWFICHFSHEGRNYAAAMIIEQGDSGGRTCAPMMSAFIKKWLLTPQ